MSDIASGAAFHQIREAYPMALTPSLTIGIEEEYQIVQPASRELRSYVQRFLAQGQTVLRDQIHPEFLQSQIELGTHICRNIQEAPD